MKTLADIKVLENVAVLLRIPQVVNAVRLKSALPTIAYLRKHHARVILVSHISGKGTETTKEMYELMRKHIHGMKFCPVPIGPEARAMVRDMVPGDVLMLENMRRNPGEEKNDPAFAKELALLGDIFVQDSFDTCHRKHASIVGVPQLLPSYAGLSLVAEVEELAQALKPKKPSLAVISGAKFSTKEPVIDALLKSYDHVYVGGALANDFIRAKGYSVGTSLVSNEGEAHIKKLLSNPRLITPVDVIVAAHGAGRDGARVAALSDIGANEAVLDAGPHTLAALVELVNASKTIVWNGPLGLFEDGFMDGTRTLARAIAHSGAHSIIGGGDTLAAIEHMGYTDSYSFVSTGGGAMLDYLAYGTLPGIEALR